MFLLFVFVVNVTARTVPLLLFCETNQKNIKSGLISTT